MPNQTVYIRNEDIEQWKSLGAKSTFIHNALRMVRDGGLEALGLIVDNRTQVTNLKEGQELVKTSYPKIIKTAEDVKKIFPEAKQIPRKPAPTYTRPEHIA